MRRYSVNVVIGGFLKRISIDGQYKFDSTVAGNIASLEIETNRWDKRDSLVFIRDEYTGDIIWKYETKGGVLVNN